LRGENLDAEERGGDANGLTGGIEGNEADIRDADAGLGDADAQAATDLDLPLVAMGAEPEAEFGLEYAVIELADVAFFDYAVNVFAIGVVAGAEVFLD
jgi:hypothetical protein